MSPLEITEENLDALVRDFLVRTLPAAQWTHHAHLLTAMMLGRVMAESELLPSLRENIAAYNVASGGMNTDSAGYHETITAFYAAVIGAYARATLNLPPAEAARRLLASPLADRGIVQRAYDPQALMATPARMAYRPPDIAGFDPRVLAAEAIAATDPGFTIRLARTGDLEDLRALMRDAIGVLLQPFLPPEKVEASREIMGLDSQLVADGTYYAVASGEFIVGCGGWSRRATLFGGDHSKGRDAALLNPATEPARVRAMYTRPGWERRGIGRLVLDTCEAAAAAEGFSACELAATLGGVPLYEACGYTAVQAFEAPTSTGLAIPLVKMRKSVSPPA
jgi:GNAT superfamily N-acetyltransferase